MTKEVVLASIDTYLGVIEAERGKMEKLRKETVEDKVKATNLRISWRVENSHGQVNRSQFWDSEEHSRNNSFRSSNERNYRQSYESPEWG